MSFFMVDIQLEMKYLSSRGRVELIEVEWQGEALV